MRLRQQPETLRVLPQAVHLLLYLQWSSKESSLRLADLYLYA